MVAELVRHALIKVKHYTLPLMLFKLLLMRIFLLTCLVVLTFSSQVNAQEVIEVVKQPHVKAEEGSSAKEELMNLAIEEASFDGIRGIIGDEKTERSKDIIINKVIKNSGRYILSMRGQNFSKKGESFVMDVTMKVSLKGLRTLLLEQGLLYQMEGPPKVLPLIQITDRVSGRRYGWWYPSDEKEHSFLTSQLDVLHKAMRDELQKIGFYSMTPVVAGMAASVPESYRGENLQRADYLFLGEYFKSSIVLRGQIVYRPKPGAENIFLIDTRLEAIHSGNGRLMAEVVRTYETDSGAFRSVIANKFREMAPKLTEDLSAQLTEAWKKGTFGSSVIKMSVVGKISPLDLENFKKTIVLQIRDIKALRERLIEARKTTYEVDSSALPQQLAQSIRSSKFAKFKVDVDDVSSEGLTLKVESK
ncbi:MAG: hypothetical protein KDD38_06520 [Bdellovibrionales bacterium]|nr:hypothetical protein [Bdellovibrionales bacterium]